MTEKQLVEIEKEISNFVYWSGEQFKALMPVPDWCNGENHNKYAGNCEACAAAQIVKYLQSQGVMEQQDGDS